MATAPILLQIDGITGMTTPLFVPIRDLNEGWRASYVLMQASKVANSDEDISTNLITWEMVKDLSSGAFKKFRDATQTRYYLPSPAGTGDTWTDNTAYPLAWTLRANEPLMCGCALTTKNGAYALKDIKEFASSLYGIDLLGNRVFVYSGGAWGNDSAGLNGTYPTGIASSGGTLYVGANSGVARMKTGGAWTDFLNISSVATAAEQFVLVGENAVGYVLWYSKDALLTERTSVSPRAFTVGDSNRRCEGLLWFDNEIIVTKRDGAYRVNPDAKLVREIMPSSQKNSLNGRVLVFYNNRAYFNMDGDFWSWDGTTRFRETPAEFESSGGTTPFYKGEVVGGHSDGAHLYIWYRVLSGSSYHYYLMSKEGQIPGEGWHPILLITTSIAPGAGLPAGSYEPGAIFYDAETIHYSIANDNTNNGRGKTGLLRTNGESPMRDATDYFTRDVAVHLGWFDGGRSALNKFLKEVRFTLRDQGTTGAVKLYYRKWADTAWTAIGESAAGTQDNTTLAIPTETGAQLGITTPNYFALKAQLTNSDTTPDNAWWLSDLYVLGLPSYTPAINGSFAAWLHDDVDDPRPLDRITVRNWLEVGIRQAAPVTITHPNGQTYKVKLDAGSEQRITRYEKDEGNEGNKAHAVIEERYVVQFREMV